ncbi:MAG: GNAT family N-acetyltransferase [Hyphomicrobiaceae bacterium]
MGIAIETSRLRLMPVSTRDLDRICDLMLLDDRNDGLLRDRDSARAAVERLIADSLDPADVTLLWCIETTGGAFAGVIGLVPQTVVSLRLRAISWRSLGLMLLLHPVHRGLGYGGEAIDAVASHALAEAMTFAIVGVVAADNGQAIKLMERTGFHVLGEGCDDGQRMIVYERSL